MHYMNIWQFFTCLNCIQPIKFHFATLDFALSRVFYFYFYHVFWLHRPTLLKKIYMELKVTDIKFSTKSSRVWLFLRFKVTLSYLYPIACKFFVRKTWILSRISHTEGKVEIGNNQSRSPLWGTILFSCSVYHHLLEIAIYLWLRSLRGTTEFQFAFRCKLTRN